MLAIGAIVPGVFPVEIGSMLNWSFLSLTPMPCGGPETFAFLDLTG